MKLHQNSTPLEQAEQFFENIPKSATSCTDLSSIFRLLQIEQAERFFENIPKSATSCTDLSSIFRLLQIEQAERFFENIPKSATGCTDFSSMFALLQKGTDLSKLAKNTKTKILTFLKNEFCGFLFGDGPDSELYACYPTMTREQVDSQNNFLANAAFWFGMEIHPEPYACDFINSEHQKSAIERAVERVRLLDLNPITNQVKAAICFSYRPIQNIPRITNLIAEYSLPLPAEAEQSHNAKKVSPF